jgi:hypothetical protein
MITAGIIGELLEAVFALIDWWAIPLGTKAIGLWLVLQLPVLVLQLLHLLRVAPLHPAVLRLPAVVSLLRGSMLSAWLVSAEAAWCSQPRLKVTTCRSGVS